MVLSKNREDKLTNAKTALIKSMRLDTQLWAQLEKDGVFSPDVRHKIETLVSWWQNPWKKINTALTIQLYPTLEDKIMALIDQVYRLWDDGYDKFVQCLEKTGQEELAKRLWVQAPNTKPGNWNQRTLSVLSTK